MDPVVVLWAMALETRAEVVLAVFVERVAYERLNDVVVGLDVDRAALAFLLVRGSANLGGEAPGRHDDRIAARAVGFEAGDEVEVGVGCLGRNNVARPPAVGDLVRGPLREVDVPIWLVLSPVAWMFSGSSSIGSTGNSTLSGPMGTFFFFGRACACRRTGNGRNVLDGHAN